MNHRRRNAAGPISPGPPSLPVVLALAALLASSVGCGYRFVEYAASARDGQPRRVAVVTLENDTYEPGVELLVSQAIRHEILGRGAFDLVALEETPDFVLRGRVNQVDSRSRSFTGDVLAREYEITLGFEVKVNRRTGKNPADASYSGRERYLASADAAVLRKNRQEALRYLSGLLARRVHDALDRALLDFAAQP